MQDQASASIGLSRRHIQTLVAPGGIVFDGPNSWDPQIHDDRFFDRLLAEGTIAVGEGYMEGQWDVEDLKEFIRRALSCESDSTLKFTLLYPFLRAQLMNLNRPGRALKSIQAHYDLGNDFFRAMLDPSMTYSCGYWEKAETLEQAQYDKYELICRKLALREGHRVLDVGCGWGGFLIHAAKRYGVRGVGVTLSENQLSLARERVGHLPIEIRLQDYRHIEDEPFDRIASIGMFEHVGHKNYDKFFDCMSHLLRKDGLFLLHTIGAPKTWNAADPWYDKYIFPDGFLPSITQIACAHEGRLVLEDLHVFHRTSYSRTLQAWYANYRRSWPQLEARYGHLVDGKFDRMWKYYLLACAGGFEAGRMLLWQLVFSHGGETFYRQVR
jgi:cyclopropane-fatty-acyl-phospholipid synthase